MGDPQCCPSHICKTAASAVTRSWNPASAGECRSWCSSHTATWSKKCAWSSGECGACDECARTSSPPTAVVGSLELTVSDAPNFAANADVKSALRKGIAAAITGLEESNVEILDVKVVTRRLALRASTSTGKVKVDYRITTSASSSAATITNAGTALKDSINTEMTGANLSFSVSALDVKAQAVSDVDSDMISGSSTQTQTLTAATVFPPALDVEDGVTSGSSTHMPKDLIYALTMGLVIYMTTSA